MMILLSMVPCPVALEAAETDEAQRQGLRGQSRKKHGPSHSLILSLFIFICLLFFFLYPRYELIES